MLVTVIYPLAWIARVDDGSPPLIGLHLLELPCSFSDTGYGPRHFLDISFFAVPDFLSDWYIHTRSPLLKGWNVVFVSPLRRLFSPSSSINCLTLTRTLRCLSNRSSHACNLSGRDVGVASLAGRITSARVRGLYPNTRYAGEQRVTLVIYTTWAAVLYQIYKHEAKASCCISYTTRTRMLYIAYYTPTSKCSCLSTILKIKAILAR